jgi:transposase
MPQNFIFPQRDQPLLLPVDMREWLPEDDLVFIVLDAVAALDLGEFRGRYRADGHGRAAFDPEMMVALLLYGYCQGERSSRVIEKRCVRDVGYRLIAGGLRPDHATIARFGVRHEAALGGLFSQVLRLLAAEGVVWLGTLSLDGANRAGTEPRAGTTDPDVRVMRNQKGYVAGYNGQAVVTADQVIVGAMLSQHPVDRTLLHPLLDQCRDQLTAAGIGPTLGTVLADAGYAREETFARAGAGTLRLLAPLAKDPGRAGALRRGPGVWTRIRPPPVPSGARAIPADETITSCGPAPWNRCSGNSRPARN